MDEKLLQKAYQDGYRRGFTVGDGGRQRNLSFAWLGEAWGRWKDENRDALDASREPGPATRVILDYARVIVETAMKLDRGQGFDRDAGRMVEDMKAFVAEHEPAKGGAGG